MARYLRRFATLYAPLEIDGHWVLVELTPNRVFVYDPQMTKWRETRAVALLENLNRDIHFVDCKQQTAPGYCACHAHVYVLAKSLCVKELR